MGMDAELTVEQRNVLDQVRESVKDLLSPHHDDEYLLRFVIARKYDVQSSVQMLQKHLMFWKQNNYDEILKDFTLDKKSLYFYTTPLGFDNEGSLIRWLRVGQTDLKGMVMSHTIQEALRIAVHLLAQDLRSQKERRQTCGDGKDCKMTYILDLQGLQWSCLFMRPLITYFLALLRAYESNFPEYLKKAYIVNVPSFFGLILNFIKNVLPSDILNKLVILNTDSKGALDNIMDPSILPVYLGGKLTSPENDPACPHLFPILPGTPVPEEFYLASTRLEGDPEAKKTVVLNQSTFTLEIEIKDANSTIIWDFETQVNDIGMGLRFKKESEHECKELIPVHRVNCHRFTESGRYDCQEPGIYEMFFDNSYSWWAKKELTYKVTVDKREKFDGTLS